MIVDANAIVIESSTFSEAAKLIVEIQAPVYVLTIRLLSAYDAPANYKQLPEIQA